MKKIFMFLMFISIALWVVGILFLDMGVEVHFFLLIAGMTFSLKLLIDELKKGR